MNKVIEKIIDEGIDSSIELRNIKVSYNFLRNYFNKIEEKEREEKKSDLSFFFRTTLKVKHYNCIAQEFLKALLWQYHILVEHEQAMRYSIDASIGNGVYGEKYKKEDYIKDNEICLEELDLIKKTIKFLEIHFQTDISEADYLFE